MWEYYKKFPKREAKASVLRPSETRKPYHRKGKYQGPQSENCTKESHQKHTELARTPMEYLPAQREPKLHPGKSSTERTSVCVQRLW